MEKQAVRAICACASALVLGNSRHVLADSGEGNRGSGLIVISIPG